jgi:flagellar basal-body rod protein FlgF
MGNLVDLGVSVLSQAERRVEIAAQNLSNATTPAYKRRVAFSALIQSTDSQSAVLPRVAAAIDFRNGKLVETGNPYDLALAGPGYFSVRYDNRINYTRQGQFSVDADGRLIDGRGGVLQFANGSDAIVESDKFVVGADGAVTEEGQLRGRIGVFGADDQTALEASDGGFSAGSASMTLLDNASVEQGAYEASNVTTGDEMVLMMEALRRAEAGQRVMNVYDDLMGRAITTFGESVR